MMAARGRAQSDTHSSMNRFQCHLQVPLVGLCAARPSIIAHIICPAFISLLSLDVDTLNRGHGKEQVLYQERFLNVHRKGSKVLKPFLGSSVDGWIVDEASVLRRDVVVVQVRSLE